MRVYFLNAIAPLAGVDLDPRRRQLYGDDVVWLRPSVTGLAGHAAEPSSSVIGPLWASRRPWHQIRIAAPDLGKRIIQFREKNSDGILMVGSHELAMPLVKMGVKFAFDPTDSAALFHLRRAKALWTKHPLRAANSLRLHLIYREMEKKIARYSAVFLTTGPADEVYLRSIAPDANILRIENGTTMVGLPVIPDHDGHTIGFHGGMTWEPNRMSALRLAGPVAAALAGQQGPQIRMRIAGRPTPEALAALDGRNGVEVCGFVEDIREWMGSLSLYVMPMYHGAGVKNKLIEAMALGIPVLTNSVGAEALPPAGRACVEIVKSDEELVRMIPILLGDRRRLELMRSSSIKFAADNFRWDKHRETLFDALQNLKRLGML